MSDAVYAVFLRQEKTEDEIFVEFHETSLAAIEACKRVARENNERLYDIPRGGVGHTTYKVFVRGMPRAKAISLGDDNG